ncbi:DUF6264 family protein [Microbacterium sp. NPDC078428]|uniref:DUF6264 family protein n=1 Tax=Microbacterium sp. NPDC078428 TaxID=3364190 RepID=UPI0037C88036
MSDPDRDARPRPQFGEYASPEEQQARIRQPDATWALRSGQAPDEADPPSAPPAPATPARAPAAHPRRRTIDRIATFALLGYGLFQVLTSIPALTDFPAYAEMLLEVMGAQAELSDPAAGRGWGIAAALVLGLGWIATAWVSWRSLRAARLTFWIPLVAGIVFNMIASTLMLIPLLNDPAVRGALAAVVGA